MAWGRGLTLKAKSIPSKWRESEGRTLKETFTRNGSAIPPEATEPEGEWESLAKDE